MRFTLLTFQGEVSDVFCIRERKNLRTSIISVFFSPYGLSPPQNTLVSFHRSRSPEHYGTTCRMIVRRKKKIERKFLSQTWVIILKHHNFNYFPLSCKKVLKNLWKLSFDFLISLDIETLYRRILDMENNYHLFLFSLWMR